VEGGGCRAGRLSSTTRLNSPFPSPVRVCRRPPPRRALRWGCHRRRAERAEMAEGSLLAAISAKGTRAMRVSCLARQANKHTPNSPAKAVPDSPENRVWPGRPSPLGVARPLPRREEEDQRATSRHPSPLELMMIRGALRNGQTAASPQPRRELVRTRLDPSPPSDARASSLRELSDKGALPACSAPQGRTMENRSPSR
jgi:hypothetical protein